VVQMVAGVLLVWIVICLILTVASPVPNTFVTNIMVFPAPVVSRGSVMSVPSTLGTARIVTVILPQKVTSVTCATATAVASTCVKSVIMKFVKRVFSDVRGVNKKHVTGVGACTKICVRAKTSKVFVMNVCVIMMMFVLKLRIGMLLILGKDHMCQHAPVFPKRENLCTKNCISLLWGNWRGKRKWKRKKKKKKMAWSNNGTRKK